MGQLGNVSPQGSIAIGIVVGILSTSIQSAGLTLQRKSHLQEDAKDIGQTKRPAYKRPKWQLGMLMFVVSNLVGSTIQITTLPLPVLSTLQASGLVFNTAFATLMLKEPFTRYSLVGTVLTCMGAALIATFGAIGEPAHNLQQLLELLERRDFIIWMAGTIIIVIATILFSHFLKLWTSHKHIEEHFLKAERPRSASLSSSQPTPLKRSFTESLPQPLQVKVSRLRLARGLCYALISGILSAHSLLVAKSAVELLVRTIIDHNNQFNRFQSWLILVALVFFALSQLYYLHLGLRLVSTSVLYPFVFCIYNIIAILDGLIYFQQVSRLSALHAGLVALGTVILLLGVLALSWRLDHTTPLETNSQIIQPTTPLTPGMGMVRGSDELERDPLLPTSRSRSGTVNSRRSSDEHTPLLARKGRTPRLSLSTPATAKDIWAELDDESDGEDILASLPRTPSPFLKHNAVRSRKSRRDDSMSSQGISSLHGSEAGKEPSSPTPDSKSQKRGIFRSNSGRTTNKPNGTESSRPRSATVRFAEGDQGSRSQNNSSADLAGESESASKQQHTGRIENEANT